MNSGVLILVVGPSGVGKDTFLGGAHEAFADAPAYVFPKRFITRPADAGGESYVEISRQDFEEAERQGTFALSWRAHGHAYGIPGVIAQELAAGRHVIVNVSRSIIDEARERFERVAVIRIDASREQLAERLAGRGREDETAIAARLDRAHAYDLADDGSVLLHNDGTREEGIRSFVALIHALTD